MKKFTGNYDVLIETAIQRFQQGGFLTGDVVKIKKNALSHEKLKEASEPVKQRIKELQETNSNLRVSAVKTIRSNTSTGEIGGVTAPSCYFADVVQELNPGMWINPMTLPLEVLEKVDHENFYPDVPESLRRLNKKSDTGSDDIGAVADTRKAEDLNLPTKNTKLTNAEKWDDSKPGAGATKELEKLKEEGVKIKDEDALSDLYEGMWDTAKNVGGAILNNVDLNYDFGKSKDQRTVSTGSGKNQEYKVKTKGSGMSGGIDIGGAARDVLGAVTQPSEEEQSQAEYERQLNQMQRDAQLKRASEELGVAVPQTSTGTQGMPARSGGRVIRDMGRAQPTVYSSGGMKTMPSAD